MKQRVSSRTGNGRRPLQSRSAENLTSSYKPSPHELNVQVGVGRCRSAHELVTDCDRELHSPSSNSCVADASGHHHPHACSRYGKRLATGARHRSRSREPPTVERVLSQEEREGVVNRMHREFSGRRKAVLNGLPPIGCTEKEVDAFLENYFCRTVSKIKDRSVRVLFPSCDEATEQLQRLNSARYEGCKLTATYGHPDSLLFVGNLSCNFTRNDLLRLFQPHGDILRCFVVCRLSTGLSKGYGFVEFASRDEAAQAKLQLATKVVGQRSLRVDFADNGMQTCDDLQSKTLFVDRLPKGFVEDDILRDKFSTYGIVNFCQVALASSGVSRGFAFIDMSTWQEAEVAQEHCNGAVLSGHDIRVSFGMPCRPGACILQHKNTISIPFIRQLGSSLHLCQKENIPAPLGDFTAHPAPSLQFTVPPMTSVPYKSHPLQLDVTRPEFIPDPSFVPCVTLSSSSNQITRSTSAPNVTLPPPSLPPSLPPPSLPPSLPPPSLPPPNHLDTISSKTTVLSAIYNPRESPDSQPSSSSPQLSRKRCAPALDAAVDSGLMAVYDRPYIGQHQQGIPFTHPLKRIKTLAH